MKYIKYALTSILIFSIIFTGCKKSEEVAHEVTPAEPVESAVQVQESAKTVSMNDFYAFLAKEPSISEFKSFLDNNLKDFDEMDTTAILIEYEEKLVNPDTLTAVNDKLYATDKDFTLSKITDNTFKREQLNSLKDEGLKKMVEEFLDVGYSIVMNEGSAYVIPNYDFFKNYSGATSEWDSYINIESKHYGHSPVEDGSIVISFDELGERLLEFETHLTTYISGIKNERLLDQYEVLLSLYMFGLDNTPIFNHKNNVIFKDAYDSYKNLANHSDTVTGRAIAEYVKSIEENDMKSGDTVSINAIEQIKEALRIMHEHK